MKLAISILTGLIVMISLSESQAQCKLFTKKQCMSSLEDFNSNGQYNGAVMFEGEEATLMQTFYSDQNYKLIVCSHTVIREALYFEVLDYRNNLLYSSQGTGSNEFEFNVESTQQLKIRVVVEGATQGTQIKKNGCVSIIVGFKE